jgi:hypothetical protein
VERQARFTVLSTCEKVVGIVHDMKGTKEDDGAELENIKQAKGILVIELIPKDQNSSLVKIPKNGDRIKHMEHW